MFYHSVTCLALELGRNDLFPDMLGFSSAIVTTPISQKSFKISAFGDKIKVGNFLPEQEQ